jgi:hypothetical protein
MSEPTTSQEVLIAENIEQQLVNPETSNTPIDFNDEKVKNHREQFEKALHEKYSKVDSNNNPQIHCSTSFIVRKSQYDSIRDVLMGVKKIADPCQRFQFRKKNYTLVDGVVHRTVQRENTGQNVTLQVVYLEQFFEMIYDVHCIKRIHQGVVKTFEQVQLRYLGIPRTIVEMFRKFCYVCDKQMSQPRLKPIISSEIFERVQLDLVDMRSNPDGEYQWVGHMVDHNGQFHVMWPMKTKSG